MAAMTARAKRSSAQGANIFDHSHMTQIMQVVGACLRDLILSSDGEDE